MDKELKALNKAFRKAENETVRDRLSKLIDELEDEQDNPKPAETEKPEEKEDPKQEKEGQEKDEVEPNEQPKVETQEKTKEKEETPAVNKEYEDVIVGLNEKIEKMNEQIEKLSGNFGGKQKSQPQESKDPRKDFAAIANDFSKRKY